MDRKPSDGHRCIMSLLIQCSLAYLMVARTAIAHSTALDREEMQNLVDRDRLPSSSRLVDDVAIGHNNRFAYSPMKQLVYDYLQQKGLPVHGIEVHKKMGDMNMHGFHGDTFSDGFGHFSTSKRASGLRDGSDDQWTVYSVPKRNFGQDAFHGDTFSDGFGQFSPTKRTVAHDSFYNDYADVVDHPTKRNFENDAFHANTFSDGFGMFSPTKRHNLDDVMSPAKKSFGLDAFHGDTFTDGFGQFSPTKRSPSELEAYPLRKALSKRSTLKRTFGNDVFHSDTFSDGFGHFNTV